MNICEVMQKNLRNSLQLRTYLKKINEFDFAETE